MCFSYEKSKIGAGYAVTFDILFEDLCVKNVEECPIFANTRISNISDGFQRPNRKRFGMPKAKQGQTAVGVIVVEIHFTAVGCFFFFEASLHVKFPIPFQLYISRCSAEEINTQNTQM